VAHLELDVDVRERLVDALPQADEPVVDREYPLRDDVDDAKNDPAGGGHPVSPLKPLIEKRNLAEMGALGQTIAAYIGFVVYRPGNVQAAVAPDKEKPQARGLGLSRSAIGGIGGKPPG
jgi:hypothetical protein